ncbi:MAG TPA: SDR family NAD(P)-dependent oxidoreductase [Phycisphaerales bacterium]|nr:SDR family NAD(P)-dependent oxidoreductase [Phycisphaerales bacterium]
MPVTFITGCSSGFGKSLALEALTRGYHVIATARDVTSLASLQAAHPGQCTVEQLDVTDARQCEDVIARTIATRGIDVLINNAGRGMLASVEDSAEAAARANFEVNFFAPMRLSQLVTPHMRQRGSGSIVMMSAAAAINNYPGFGVYGASKCALEGLAESLKAELAPFGIKVMIVQPGPFRTEFIAKGDMARGREAVYAQTVGRFAALLAGMPGKQPGDPARAASAILDAIAADNTPTRLVLGKYTVNKQKTKLAATGTELAAWESVAVATDGR